MSAFLDHTVTRRLFAVVAAMVAAIAAVALFAPTSARAADAASDSSCATKPASVPDGYGCVVIYEPNGKSNGTYGEVWYLRDTSNVLHLMAFATLKADDNVLLCARTSGPYTPSNSNQQDKCIGNTPSLIYQGPVGNLGPNGGQSLNGVTTDAGTPVYWVLHVAQGGKTTVGLGAAAGAPTVSFSDSCTDGITATLSNTAGTGPAVFSVTSNGGSAISKTVAAGATDTATAPLQGNAASMTVSASGLAPVTHTYDASVCNTGSTPTAHPAASIAGDCTSHVIVTLDNSTGTADVTFTVVDGSTSTQYNVPAGGKTTLDLGSTTGSRTVTVSAPGMTGVTKTLSCPATHPSGGTQGGTTGGGSTGPQHAINPTVSFATACKSGITATFTNMKLDDTTMDPVTFTVTTPSGGSDSVTVAADQIVKRSYPVKEDTTGTLTVSAPGMAKQSKSYAKNCTSVLGEKVTKRPKKPVVQGEKATRLPFTGVPAGQLALEALALVCAGCVLTYAGRRSTRGAHARR